MTRMQIIDDNGAILRDTPITTPTGTPPKDLTEALTRQIESLCLMYGYTTQTTRHGDGFTITTTPNEQGILK